MAGIIGCNYGSGAKYIIKNCYNIGNVSGSNESAAISGWLGNNALVENCWNSGTIEGFQTSRSFARFSSVTFTNCYQLDTIEEQSEITTFIKDDLPSGKLASVLSESWGQYLGENPDTHPVFRTTENAVYIEYEENSCIPIKYTNDSTVNHIPIHDETYENVGKCIDCGSIKPGSVYELGLDFTNQNENISSFDYSWEAETKTLTLTDFTIDLVNSTIIKLPSDATILLKGNNKITSSSTSAKAIYSLGSITIKGEENSSFEISVAGGSAIYCENSEENVELKIEDTTLNCNGEINLPSVNKSSIFSIKNSNVETNAKHINIYYTADNETQTGGISVENSTLNCGRIYINDGNSDIGNVVFNIKESTIYSQQNDTSGMHDAISINGGSLDIDIIESKVTCWNRCGAWNWGHSYPMRIYGTNAIEMDIKSSDLLLYGTNLGMAISSATPSGSVENSTIISYAKQESAELTGIEDMMDDCIVFSYSNAENSNKTGSVVVKGNPIITHDFIVPEGLGGLSDLSIYTPQIILSTGQSITVSSDATFEIPDKMSFLLLDDSFLKGNIIGNIEVNERDCLVEFIDKMTPKYIHAVSVVSGDSISEYTLPDLPTYEFVGWYTDEEYITEFDFNQPINESLKLYAKYIGKLFSVTWDIDGTLTTETVRYGDVIKKSDLVPTKDGYQFVG